MCTAQIRNWQSVLLKTHCLRESVLLKVYRLGEGVLLKVDLLLGGSVQSRAEVTATFLNVDNKSLAEQSPRPGHSRVTAIHQNTGELPSFEGYKVPVQRTLENPPLALQTTILRYPVLLCIAKQSFCNSKSGRMDCFEKKRKIEGVRRIERKEKNMNKKKKWQWESRGERDKRREKAQDKERRTKKRERERKEEQDEEQKRNSQEHNWKQVLEIKPNDPRTTPDSWVFKRRTQGRHWP